MRHAVMVLVALAGCAPRTPPPLANRAAATPLACTTDAVEHLTHVLSARWNAPALALRCVAGQFRSAGYFVEAIVEGQRRTGIVDPSGAELVPFVDEVQPGPYTFVAGYVAADLDGDGEDEVIEAWRRTPTYALVPDNWLVIRTVSGNRLRRIIGPYVSRYRADLGSCNGSWALKLGTIHVTVSAGAGIPPIECLPTGRHRFELRGHALVDISR